MAREPAFLRRALAVMGAGVVLAAALSLSAPRWSWGLSYDPQVSGCLPWTLYLVHRTRQTTARLGTLVIVRQGDLEKAAALEFAQDRKGGPQEIPPAVKYVAAVAGDRVQVKDDGIWVNDRYYGRLWLKDWVRDTFSGLHSGWASSTVVVPAGQVLVLGTEPLAFDGRYFGLIPESDIIGRAWPI
jgi:conjugal transfer pilin signal peptidase TrbI